MTANFALYQNYAVHFEDKHLDLHNNYDFEGFTFNADKRQLILTWRNTQADWVPEDNPPRLAITIYNVDFLKVTPRNSEVPFSDDTCLTELTYYPSSERHVDNCLCEQENPTGDDDLIFRFESEQIIRVKGSNVEVDIAST